MMLTWAKSFRALPPLALFLGVGISPAMADPVYALLTTIAVPPSADNSVGGNFNTYDISFIDGNTQTDYVADRSNASVDVFSTATNTFVGRIGGGVSPNNLFSGQTASSDTSGPDGVLVTDTNALYAGNGNSTVLAFDLGNANLLTNSSAAQLPGSPIVTGSDPTTAKRADEMAYDPTDKRVIVANDAASPSPYLSLIDTTNNTVVAKTVLDGTGGTPNATGGIEQSVWDPNTHKFYVSIPEINGGGPGGITEIDPLTGGVDKTFSLSDFGISACGPTGLSRGIGSQLMIACGTKGSQAILFDPTANGGKGAVIKTFAQVSGSDEDWFDPNNNLFYVTGENDPNGPLLGIIDGLNATYLQSLSTTPGDHSVAGDPVTGDIYVPFGGVAGNTVCPKGCIAVFAPVPEPDSLALIGSALLGLIGVTAWRRRKS